MNTLNSSSNDQVRQQMEVAEAALRAALALITESFEKQLAGISELPGRTKVESGSPKSVQTGKRRGRPKKEQVPTEPEGTTAAESKI